MSRTVTAVVDGNGIHTTEPIDVPDGTLVEVRVPESEASGTHTDPAEEMRLWDEALQAFWEEGKKLGPEWWAQFKDDLRRNRMTFEERF